MNVNVLRRSIVPACALVALASAGAHAAEPAGSEYDCLIEARQQVDVRSSVEGVIESVPVTRGQVVKKGTLLAKLSSGPERAALTLARSRATMVGEVRAAEARVELTRKKWERAKELEKGKFVSANSRDEAEAEYHLAKEQLRAVLESRKVAELDAKRAEEVLAQRSIHSPIDGVVVAVLLQPGELTSSNQKDPIMTLMEVDPLNVELVLPVSQYGRIKPGQMAEVRPEEPVGGRYEATVEVVDPTVDAASGTFGVRLKLPNPGTRIPAGVKCRARF